MRLSAHMPLNPKLDSQSHMVWPQQRYIPGRDAPINCLQRCVWGMCSDPQVVHRKLQHVHKHIADLSASHLAQELCRMSRKMISSGQRHSKSNKCNMGKCQTKWQG